MPNIDPSRRQFLAFLAASPLLAAVGLDESSLDRLVATSPRGAERALDLAQQLAQQSVQDTTAIAGIKEATDALNVFDFEPVAKARIPVAHWGYLATGTCCPTLY